MKYNVTELTVIFKSGPKKGDGLDELRDSLVEAIKSSSTLVWVKFLSTFEGGHNSLVHKGESHFEPIVESVLKKGEVGVINEHNFTQAHLNEVKQEI